MGRDETRVIRVGVNVEEVVLWIAEKDSLISDAILPALPGKNDEESKGYVRRGNHHFVALNGHALEQAMPDHYLPDSVPRTSKGSKVWRLEDLPIVPTSWHMVEKESKRARLRKVQELLRLCTVVHHVGDPDPEGQLIVDEVLEHFGNRKPVKRVLINDYNQTKVKQALANIRDNNEAMFRGWSLWAKARSRYDWLVGINATRAMTVRGKSLGYGGLLPVGSVQTPVQFIMVEHDRKIEGFVSRPFFKLAARIEHPAGTFVARWKPKDGQDGMEDGRLVDPLIAENLVVKVKGQSGSVSDHLVEPKEQPAPLTMGLDELQMDAFSRYGYTGDQTMAAAQKLYETYKVATYPRSDNRYLSEAQHASAPAVMDCIFRLRPDLGDMRELLDSSRKSAAFDDKKMVNGKGEPTPHHAIVPTIPEIDVDLSAWSQVERDVYDMIVRSYLAQFAPAHEYLSTTIQVDVADETFAAQGRISTAEGWRLILKPVDSDEDSEGDDTEPEADQQLPTVAIGDRVSVVDCIKSAAKTTPPARFDEKLIRAAMKNVHKYVRDSAIRARLKEGDGIGTTATRSPMIKEMKDRGVIVPIKPGSSKLMTSEQTRALIDALPSDVKEPMQAGVFKLKLDQVATGDLPFEQFMQETITYVTGIVALANDVQMDLAKPASTMDAPCPRCKGQLSDERKAVVCTGCDFKMWKEVAGRALSATEINLLLAGKTTRELSGFVSAAKRKFSAKLRLELETGKVQFVFEEKASTAPVDLSVPCPKCKGPLRAMGNTVECAESCGFKLWTEVASRRLETSELNDLLVTGRTELLSGFVTSKTPKKKFSARLVLDPQTGRTSFEFEARK